MEFYPDSGPWHIAEKTHPEGTLFLAPGPASTNAPHIETTIPLGFID